MKQNFFHCLYIALVFLLLILPSLGMLMVEEAEAGANEVLAAKPSLREPDGSFNQDILTDVTHYIADRFAFRQEFVTAWARLNADLLHTSVEDKVLLGKDGWLYYTETEADYMGQGLTDGELQTAARNLALVQEYAESQGAKFLFTIAPNKNSLYPEHMPSYIPKGVETANRTRLPAYLADAGVHYADLYAAFENQEDILYFATDSHWTSKGAALAADTLLSAVGKDTAYFAGDFSTETEHLGDLYEMLYPTGDGRETDRIYTPGFTFTYDTDPNGGNAITIKTQNTDRTGSLLCFRDSFGISLHPYLAEEYSKALFSRQTAYDLTQIGTTGVDTVIIELVERNLYQLVTEAAVFPAPTRKNLTDEITPSAETLTVTVTPGQTAGTAHLRQVQGTLAPGMTDEGSPMYLLVDSVWYEATVLTGDTSGFSAWIPAGDTTNFRLMTCCGGVNITYRCTVQS